jgi:hypothetical protein
MEFANPEEFWSALSRLYDSTLEMKGHLDQLGEISERLVHATDILQRVAEAHERRLDRTEITIEAILEDLRRSREKGTQ